MNSKKSRHKLEWQNIYYMLCYCIDEMVYFKDADVDYEKLNSTNDLLASLLCTAFESLYRNGYIKEYSNEQITTDKPRGRIDIPRSIITGSIGRGQLVCNVSNMGIDTKLNRIIKASFSILIEADKTNDDKIDDDLVTRLYRYREMLRVVSDINISARELDGIRDIPEYYKPIISICKLIWNDWIASDKDGEQRLLKLDKEKRLCYIWQKYLLNFCKKQFNQLEVSNPTWEDGKKKINGEMQVRHRYVDLLLKDKQNKKAIIADAKYYNLGDANSISNTDQVNAYCDIFIKGNKNYKTTGLLLIASNENTDEVGNKVRDDETEIKSYDIKIDQDKEDMERDIINIIEKYII